MAMQSDKPSGDGGYEGQRAPFPVATALELLQRQAQAVFQATQQMAEGFFTSAALLGEAASVVADSVRRRAAAWDLPFGPLSVWHLSREEETEVEKDIARSVAELVKSTQNAMATLMEWRWRAARP